MEFVNITEKLLEIIQKAYLIRNINTFDMNKKLCPQCKIPNFYIKNSVGDILPIYLFENGNIVPKSPEKSLEGYDLSEIFCLGCSFHGSTNKFLSKKN